jgi:hypothetical protein
LRDSIQISIACLLDMLLHSTLRSKSQSTISWLDQTSNYYLRSHAAPVYNYLKVWNNFYTFIFLHKLFLLFLSFLSRQKNCCRLEGQMERTKWIIHSANISHYDYFEPYNCIGQERRSCVIWMELPTSWLGQWPAANGVNAWRNNAAATLHSFLLPLNA